jgi:hypothetical protein
MSNAIAVIYPYKHEGMWVFDDERVGLVQEPFVAGADVLIDKALEAKGIKDGDKGFRLIFSAGEFPLYDFKFSWLREGDGGNWYFSDDFNMEGWLCPALFEYFDKAPKEIYTKFEAKDN